MNSMNIDSQKWEQLQELFHLALAAPPDEREQLLAEACPDPDVRRRVMAILSASEAEPAPAGDFKPELNERVGPYHLVRHLGTGGIGSVYLAERLVGNTPQRFALKVLAQHAAGPQFEERFHREQHILASLEHPNTTRMLDAGVSEHGHPYLVMEYVNGAHLNVHCDKHRLGVRERLELFLQVCDAVAYAHRNLIVHLDLKPSNILVTKEGVAKLLDFGTSKIIQPDSLLTTTIMATPAYASPEQLRNEAVTTACDIYSLGAVLFELLSGRRPGGTSSIAIMMERALREEEPERMQSAATEEAAGCRGLTLPRIRTVLRGDLENIVSKCLRHRPKDRYSSVDVFMADIRRYLDGRPVTARPQTALYRFGKFARRNRKGVAAAALASLILATSIGYAGWRQHQAVLAGQRAIRMQTMMFSLFSIARWQYSGKPTMSVNDFLNLGVRTLPLYIHDRADLRAAQLSLAESLLQNSDYTDAQRVFEEVAQSAQNENDVNAETQALASEGDIANYRGQVNSATTLLTRALALSHNSKVSPLARVSAERLYAINREVNGIHSDDNLRLLNQAVQEAQAAGLPAVERARPIFGLALTLRGRNHLDKAEARYKEALQLYTQDPAYACDAAEPEGELGRIQLQRGELSDALVHNQHAFQVITQCAGPDNAEARYLGRFVAQDLLWLGRGPEALAIMKPIVYDERKADRGAGGPHLANFLYVLSWANLATGNPAESEKLVKEEMALAKGKLSPSSAGFGTMYLLCAQALAAEHRDREALSFAELAVSALGQAEPDDGYQDKQHISQAQVLLATLKTQLATESSGPAEK
ncbi:MAG: protein kinase [Acidobacteriaceae bacterium]